MNRLVPLIGSREKKIITRIGGSFQTNVMIGPVSQQWLCPCCPSLESFPKLMGPLPPPLLAAVGCNGGYHPKQPSWILV